ncbi:nuclear fragile X mental retardation-interacting protein 1-domain-containing protein [Pisolithus microcarpus]|nr:nuclear fragile X mental retardation-interacting protein 1-domain-containing protein [Pisolithus microcarpus]
MQPPPQNNDTASSWSTSGHPPIFNTGAMTAALANPYAQSHVLYGMSPHYYNAYVQASYNRSHPATTPDGYTLSSTYTPRQGWRPENKPLPSPFADHTPSLPPAGKRVGCPFMGSQKSTEWDADPSLKGKPVLIQGTSVLLDTPEAIDTWIAERRKRFPTSERVEEKKRKFEEAIARGQLTPEDMGLGGTKTRKHSHPTEGPPTNRWKRSGRGGGNRRGALGRRDGVSQTVNARDSTASQSAAPDKLPRQIHLNTDTDSDSGEEPPEETTSRGPPGRSPDSAFNTVEVSVPLAKPLRPPPQPKKPPRTPFMSRPDFIT